MNIMSLLWLFGGLGLFLYGMKIMGDGLESSAGTKLKDILEKVTANPISSVIVGTIVTAIIQSSSATTVMVVGFVNSGILNLVQATGIIMGANIGTTVTAFLVSINIGALIPVTIALGTGILLFSKSKKRRDLALIMLGFGILMQGMESMKDALMPLSKSPEFTNAILSMSNHWYLGLLAGLGLTLLVQSSSATTGILIALTATGSITLELAWPYLLGANIGTCITALLSSITANKTAKRAAVIHLLFNSIGALIFLPFGLLLINLVKMIAPGNTAIEISFMHLIFNVSNTILLLPFSNQLIKLSGLIVGQDEVPSTKVLDARLLETPSIALGQAISETVGIAQVARQNISLATDAFINNDLSHLDELYANEERINRTVEAVTTFLVKLSSSSFDINGIAKISSTYHLLNDIERIGDHAENIMELAQERNTKSVDISSDAKSELANIRDYCLLAIDTAIAAYDNQDLIKAQDIISFEARIDSLEKEYRKSHIDRLTNGSCNPLAGILFLDLLSNLERVGDHSKNIADVILEGNSPDLDRQVTA